MNSYTITIAPNDDSGNSTTLIVDTSETDGPSKSSAGAAFFSSC